MGLDYPGLLADLRHESDRLAEHLTALTHEQWALPTPAKGWSIHDQMSHLAFFDDTAFLALTGEDQFRSLATDLVADGMDFPDRIAEQHRSLTPESLLDWFRAARHRLLEALAAQEPKRRLPWFGPDMSVASSATARLMETWAHGQDVYDTLGVEHPPSPGLRSIAHLGVTTFAFAHILNGLVVPDESVHIALEAPDGTVWTWGPESSANRITGPAEGFVLTVTQRRHWTETALTVDGPVAQRWLDLAQAFAGAPSRRAVA
ncbi:MAG: hypothetical protein QOG19_721 [Mycobacterium sp.]|nr:hypothetical protein [Mycobacterium sp.]